MHELQHPKMDSIPATPVRLADIPSAEEIRMANDPGVSVDQLRAQVDITNADRATAMQYGATEAELREQAMRQNEAAAIAKRTGRVALK